MSVLTTNELQFEFPKKPSTKDPFEIADLMGRWIKRHVPYMPNGYYRPELALAKGGVNCYGIAQATSQLAEHWNIPSGIVLDKSHAHTVVKCGAAVLFIDAMKHEDIRATRQEAERHENIFYHELKGLYNNYLPDALESGDFSLYFHGPLALEGQSPWSVRSAQGIRTGRDLTQHYDPHIITNATRGAEMLCAIGDLKRYQMIDPERYEQEFPALISLVPDFMDFDRPGIHDTVSY